MSDRSVSKGDCHVIGGERAGPGNCPRFAATKRNKTKLFQERFSALSETQMSEPGNAGPISAWGPKAGIDGLNTCFEKCTASQ